MYSLFTDVRGVTQIISCKRLKISIPVKNGGIKPRFEWCDSDPLNQLLEEFSNRINIRQPGVAQIFSAKRFESWIPIN